MRVEDMLMIASGAGIIADIATPAERGGFVGKFILGPLVRAHNSLLASYRLSTRLVSLLVPSSEERWLKHLTGGITNLHHRPRGIDALFRAIFWFLCISSALCFFGLILFVLTNSYLNLALSPCL